MEYRVCARCGQYKSVEDFYYHEKTSRYASYCDPCRKEYQAEQYKKTREKRLKRFRERLDRFQFRVGQIKRDRGCVDCGERDPSVLEFDHRDPTTKIASVSRIVKSSGWARIELEIQKCDVRCRVCHQARTNLQREAGELGDHWQKAVA